MDDRRISIDDAEKMAGVKLDRRRVYGVVKEGELCFMASYTIRCSGCTEDSEYSFSLIGSGCRECGYTGKRRINEWQPAYLINKALENKLFKEPNDKAE
jgi:hypothetical protein